MLLNVGFAEAMKDFNFTCTIFHDIDLFPMNETNLYNCPTRMPLHMSARVSTFAYKLPYPTIFGGVTALTRQHFEQVNGFSNMFWGWGGEDDDMYNRVRDHGLDIARKPEDGYYKMARHKAEVKNPDRRKMLNTGSQRCGFPMCIHVYHERCVSYHALHAINTTSCKGVRVSGGFFLTLIIGFHKKYFFLASTYFFAFYDT